MEKAGPGEKKGEVRTPALKAFGRDLTEIARKGEMDPVIGRDRSSWNERHGNALNSDELTTVVAPTFELACVTDPTHHFPVAGAQDSEGFYYASPAWAGDKSVISKYNMRDCGTEWSITGEPDEFLTVADAPMTLTDPETVRRSVVVQADPVA